MSQSKSDALAQIKDEVINLTKSPLYKERKSNNAHPVIGEGNLDAKIMLIGEAPGKNEAKSGRPFCGAAGRVLDELLVSAGIKREEVYITNIVKDRPTKNRDPQPEEIEIYSPFLDRQIEIIQPKILAALGRYSMEYLMKKYNLESFLKPISAIHGKSFATELSYGTVSVVPLFHPAASIYRRELKETLISDFYILKQTT